MSVVIEALTVVVPQARVGAGYPGGLAGYQAHCPNATWRCDGLLTAISFMVPEDVEAFVLQTERMSRLSFRSEQGTSVDIAVVDQHDGPTLPCPWLSFEVRPEGYAVASLIGASPTALATPQGWTLEQARTLTFRTPEQMDEELEWVREEGGVDVYVDRQGREQYIGHPTLRPETNSTNIERLYADLFDLLSGDLTAGKLRAAVEANPALLGDEAAVLLDGIRGIQTSEQGRQVADQFIELLRLARERGVDHAIVAVARRQRK
ncbi:hypothetical protein [Streptomyces sp. NPDC001410]|uniref:hypothetical protein n=1 Tax=Streptomyces sp. NPDC001410 TaxID=3364574 RepID=UPI0036966CF5